MTLAKWNQEFKDFEKDYSFKLNHEFLYEIWLQFGNYKRIDDDPDPHESGLEEIFYSLKRIEKKYLHLLS